MSERINRGVEHIDDIVKRLNPNLSWFDDPDEVLRMFGDKVGVRVLNNGERATYQMKNRITRVWEDVPKTHAYDVFEIRYKEYSKL